MPSTGSRIQARPLSRPRPMRRKGRPSHSSRHAPASTAFACRLSPLRAACPRPQPRSRRHAAPGNTASSTPPPTTRPAQTGPWADFGRPIVLGINLCKGVYEVRQLTPPYRLTAPTLFSREPGAGSRDLRLAIRLSAGAGSARRGILNSSRMTRCTRLFARGR